MIKRIKRILNRIEEKFIGYIEDSSTGSEMTPINLNPSKDELYKLMKEYGYVRVLVDRDDLSDIYVWDGNGAYHEEVESEFSYGGHPGIISNPNNEGLVWEVNIHADDEDFSDMDDEDIADMCSDYVRAPIVARYGINKIYVTPSVLVDVKTGEKL